MRCSTLSLVLASGLFVGACRRPLGYCESPVDCGGNSVCDQRYRVCVRPEADAGQAADAGPSEAMDGATDQADAGLVVHPMDAGSLSLRCDGGYCGRWGDAGLMVVTRVDHRSVLLADGRVLVAGGAPDPASEVFDPATGTWRQSGDMKQAVRSHHFMLRLRDERVLACGGDGAPSFSSSCEIFDPAAETWSLVTPMLEPRMNAAASILNDGRVLVAGGLNSMGCRSTAEIYSPDAGTWSPLPAMSFPRSGAVAATIPGGRVVILGGVNCNSSPSTAPSTVEVFNPETSAWGSLGVGMSRGRLNPTLSVLAGGNLLAVGAAIEDAYSQTAEYFDRATTEWVPGGMLSSRRESHTASVLVTGEVLVVGGYFDATTPGLDSVELFSPVSRAWSPAPPLRVGRRGHSATVMLDGRVLVTGGIGTMGRLRSAEIFE